MAEVGYLIYCGRYFYPAVILCIFLATAINFGIIMRQQRLRLMALVNEVRLTPMVWGGWVRATSSHRLLPGDVVVLQQGKALCDVVMLQGNCLVVESTLTGEVHTPPFTVYHHAITAFVQKHPCINLSLFRSTTTHRLRWEVTLHGNLWLSSSLLTWLLKFILTIQKSTTSLCINGVSTLSQHYATPIWLLAISAHGCHVQLSSCSHNIGLCEWQAAQVRKTGYVPEKGVDYAPDKNHTSTV